MRDEAYFKRICDAFGEDNVFFFAKINLEKLIAFLKEQIKTGDSDSVALAEKDLEEAEKLKKDQIPQHIFYTVALMILFFLGSELPTNFVSKQ